jgi:hypothetical protein
MMLTNKLSHIFNKDTITLDDDVAYARLYTTIYPKVTFIEDARPDYFIKRETFDNILKKIYNTTGESIYKIFSSGKCMDIRLIHRFKTMIIIHFYIERDIAECAYRLSGKDLGVVAELGDMDYLQLKLDKISTKVYNALELAPFASEAEMTQGLIHSLFYPISKSELGTKFCIEYNKARYDRIGLRDLSKFKTKIGFDIPKEKES